MSAIEVYGARWSAESNQLLQHLRLLEVPHRYVDIDDDGAAAARVERWNRGERRIPTVVIDPGGEETVLARPASRELDRELSRRGLLPIVPASGEPTEI